MQPTLEDRVEALEANITRVEAGTLKAFKEIKAIMATKQDTSRLETRLEAIEARLDKIEATMATKQDVEELEARLANIETCNRAIEKKLDQLIEAMKRH